MKSSRFSITNVNVVFVDIPENEIASYITATKLLRDTLTKGQRACIVINLYYEEERRKAKERMVAGAIETNEKRWGVSGTSEMEGAIRVEGEVAEILSKKSGVGKMNIAYLKVQ